MARRLPRSAGFRLGMGIDGGGKDVFVHISVVEKAGYTGLAEGAKVSFDIVPNRGKESAENLKLR
jgi:cold shock protein